MKRPFTTFNCFLFCYYFCFCYYFILLFFIPFLCFSVDSENQCYRCIREFRRGTNAAETARNIISALGEETANERTTAFPCFVNSGA